MSEMAEVDRRRMDVTVLRRLFGLKAHQPEDGGIPGLYIPSGKPWKTHAIDALPVPRFTESLLAAWAIVDRLGGLGWHVAITRRPEGDPFATGDASRYGCAFRWTQPQRAKTFHFEGAAYGPTLPIAVCRAALKLKDEADKFTYGALGPDELEPIAAKLRAAA